MYGLKGMLGGSWAQLAPSTLFLAAGPGTAAAACASGLPEARLAAAPASAAAAASDCASALADCCAGRRGLRVVREF